jgi:pantetheine-phosphate adenylyltransferase
MPFEQVDGRNIESSASSIDRFFHVYFKSVLKKYTSIGLGGTFDHLHVGHRHFLEFAGDLAEHLIIGIVQDDLAQRKDFAFGLQQYSEREAALRDFLNSQSISHQLFPLTDAFGPTLLPTGPEAVAVTQATQKGGELINQKRKELGLAELPVCVCNLLKDISGEFISSTRIRAGKINREGEIFARLLNTSVRLNEFQRDFFSQPQGKIIHDPVATNYPMYVIGDVVLDVFLEKKIPFTLGAFDRQSLRKSYQSPYLNNRNFTQLKSKPGIVEPQVVSFMETTIDALQLNEQALLEVTGEEDLIAVILGVIAPLGSRIYYGQSGEGIVEMIVTENLKEKFADVLTR